MNKKLLLIALFPLTAFASSYSVIISKDNNNYDSDIYSSTGNIVCNSSVVETDLYFGEKANQLNTNCKEEFKSTGGNTQWRDHPDYNVEITGSHIEDNCKNIKIFDSSLPSGTYPVNITGSNENVICDMTTDGGGWTLVLDDSHSGSINNGIFSINDKLLSYTEVLYFDENSLSDFGGSSFNDGVWDWQGFDLGKNVLKFDTTWSNMQNKFNHVCNVIPESDKLPSSSYRIVEHNVSTCLFGTTNVTADCARKVAITVPVGKRFTGFSDVETIHSGCNSDNRFNIDFKFFVR